MSKLVRDEWASMSIGRDRELKSWLIPVTIIEYGREAVVEASSKSEALKIFRNQGWDELTDAKDFKVTKVGPVKELK